MVKTLSKPGIEGNFCNLIKNSYKDSTAIIMLNHEKLDAFSLRLETRQRCTLSSLFFKIVLEVLASAIRGEREIKYTNWKGRSKTLFVHRRHCCLCRKSQRINKQKSPGNDIYKIHLLSYIPEKNN